MSLSATQVTLVLGDGDQQIKALDDVSLEVKDGECVAVVGPSGAGKSSLLAVCGALRPPTAGKIHVAKEDLTALSPKELTALRRDKIGFVFQQSNLVPSLSAIEQLLLIPHLRGKGVTSAHKEKAQGLLGEVGLDAKLDNRPAEMSGGERQRVGIARALMCEPEILLIDEPTSMLDHSRGEEIMRVITREAKTHNVATLLVTHDVTMLEDADHVFKMEDGRLSAA